MSDNNAVLRSELTPIVAAAMARASSAQQCALPDPSTFVDAIIGVVERERLLEVSSILSWYDRFKRLWGVVTVEDFISELRDRRSGR